MASIYKREKDQNDRRVSWIIGYTDHHGKRITVKGFTDKGETERLAAKLEHEAMMRKRGLIDPKLERAALQRAGLLKTLLDDFERSLGRNGDNTKKHVQLTMSRVRGIIEIANFVTVADIEREPVEAAVQSLQKSKKFGNRTYNHYLQAMGSFCNWMIPDRMSANPLIGVATMNEEVDIRHRRRAISPEEIQLLVRSARDSGLEIQRFDGEQRARIYIIAYMTGLRRKEISQLTKNSFDLNAKPETLTVDAIISKHRKKDVLPIHPDLVQMLKEWLPSLPDGEKLFPNLEFKKTWKMVKKDLERVGIPYKNEDGIADFHAAGRHTYITGLMTNGTSVVEAMQLARHSDVRTTMRYTHVGLDKQADAIKNLPWKPAAPAAKTNDSAQHSSSESGGTGCQNEATDGTRYVGKDAKVLKEKPCRDRVYRDKASHDNGCQEWRRRGSKPPSNTRITD